jgi:protein-S-isoprenylcysteine O-methyltransferase Ste14
MESGGTMAHEQQPGEPRSASDEIRRIVREELDVMRAEEWARTARLARGVAALAVAFFLFYLGAVFLTLMAVYILGTQIEPWMGAAIVGGAVVVAATLVGRWAWRVFRESSRG